MRKSSTSVAISDDGLRMVVGSPGDATNSGSVKVYESTGGVWSQIGTIPIGGSGDQKGFSVSLSADGSIVAVGSPYSDANGGDSGSVSIYQYAGSGWTLLGTSIDGLSAGNENGYAISLSSDGLRIAIGSPDLDNGTFLDVGGARIFEYSGGSWNQLGLTIFGPSGSSRTAQSIALSADGNTVAIGAPDDSADGGTSNGAVRVYQWNGTAWYQLGDAIAGNFNSGAGGSSVSLNNDGTIVAFGSPLANHSSTGSGSTLIAQWNPTTFDWDPLGPSLGISGPITNANAGSVVVQ